VVGEQQERDRCQKGVVVVDIIARKARGKVNQEHKSNRGQKTPLTGVLGGKTPLLDEHEG